MTLSSLEARAGELIDDKNFVGARPYLEELVKRFQGEDASKREHLTGVYFYLGIGYLVDYSAEANPAKLQKAIDWLTKLNTDFPNNGFAVQANMAMADAYRGLQKWMEAAKIYKSLLTPPLEMRLSNAQRLDALKKISQAYYIKQDWAGGEPWFKKFLEESKAPDDQALAAAALMEAAINSGKFDRVIALFPYLVGETPSRYGLQLNVALLQAGDKLAAQKSYGEAMLMYRMVLTLEEILEWQEARLVDLKGQFDLLKLTTGGDSDRAMELEAEIFNTQAQVKALKGLNSYTPDLRIRIARNYLLTGRDWESFWAYNELIKDYPKSESIEDFVYAAFTGAANIGLADEVIELGEFYLKNKQWERYRADIMLRIAQFYLDRGQVEDFFALARDFIAKDPNDKYCSQMVYLMGTTYMRQQDFIGMIDQFKEYLKKYPGAPMSDGLQYWIGMSYFFQQDYPKAMTYFNTIIKDYERSAYYEDSLYRKGICFYGEQNMAEARKTFEQFIVYYPRSNLRGEVEYFLGDVESSVANVKPALEHYANVEKYTDNIGFIENAYFSAGDLLEANKRYDDMAELFQQYLNKYRSEGDVTRAIYMLGHAREQQGRPGDMLKEYWRAIERFGNDSKAYGLDRIVDEYADRYYQNQEHIQANLDFLEKVSTEASFRNEIASKREVLFSYLSENPNITEDVKRPFYDSAFRLNLTKSLDQLQPMVNKYRAMREAMPVETPEEQFKLGYETAMAQGDRTLAVRLQKALSDRGVDLNPGEVFTEEDFAYGSPSTLIWMGDRNSDFDPSLARKAYQQVLTAHADSTFALDALLALGELELEEGNYAEAISYFDKAESRFPGESRIVKAAMARSDALMKSGKVEDARDGYKAVLDNRSWRGSAHAEALYKIGQSYMDSGNLDMAQTYFERTYIGYSAFPEWAGAAYLQSGKVLEQMGRPQDAARTYDEFLELPEYNGTKYFEQIKNARAAL